VKTFFSKNIIPQDSKKLLSICAKEVSHFEWLGTEMAKHFHHNDDLNILEENLPLEGISLTSQLEQLRNFFPPWDSKLNSSNEKNDARLSMVQSLLETVANTVQRPAVQNPAVQNPAVQNPVVQSGNNIPVQSLELAQHSTAPVQSQDVRTLTQDVRREKKDVRKGQNPSTPVQKQDAQKPVVPAKTQDVRKDNAPHSQKQSKAAKQNNKAKPQPDTVRVLQRPPPQEGPPQLLGTQQQESSAVVFDFNASSVAATKNEQAATKHEQPATKREQEPKNTSYKSLGALSDSALCGQKQRQKPRSSTQGSSSQSSSLDGGPSSPPDTHSGPPSPPDTYTRSYSPNEAESAIDDVSLEGAANFLNGLMDDDDELSQEPKSSSTGTSVTQPLQKQWDWQPGRESGASAFSAPPPSAAPPQAAPPQSAPPQAAPPPQTAPPPQAAPPSQASPPQAPAPQAMPPAMASGPPMMQQPMRQQQAGYYSMASQRV